MHVTEPSIDSAISRIGDITSRESSEITGGVIILMWPETYSQHKTVISAPSPREN